MNASAPLMSTMASPTAVTVGVASTVKDTATLTGGDAPSGSVTFTLYSNAGCTTLATPGVSGSGMVSAGTASYSTSWTPTTVGTYYWQAIYSGDSNNSPITSCGGTNEQLTVNASAPLMSTMASPTAVTVGVASTVKDTATLTGGDAPSGSVTFTLYSNAGCTTLATPGVSGSGMVSAGTASYSTSWTPTTVGTYYWQAIYSGDSNNSPITSCGGTNEQLTVNASAPLMSTMASPTAVTVGVASTVKDTATLTGGDAPSGSVTFTLYSNAGCTTLATPGVSGSGMVSAGTASYSTSWTPTTVGTYYWQAIYSGDSNNSPITSCGGTNEQLTVNASAPLMSTMASPTAVTVGVASTVKDTATLTGGDAPSGSVTFTLYSNAGCTTLATPGVSGSGMVSAGTASYSTSWTPTTVGTYYWQAIYSGDSNNSPITSCGGTNEQLTVNKATPSVTTQASPTTGTVGVKITAGDTATLTGGDAPSGSVTFSLYSSSSCTGTPVITGSDAISGGTASYSTSWTPPSPGTYYWTAAYGGDPSNSGVTTTCNASHEDLVIGKATPTVSTQASPTTGTVGASITAGDTATLLGGASPTGTVTFDLYSTSGCTGTPVLSGSGTISGATASYSTSWTPAAPGTYNWQATYNGDANNGTVTTACGGSTEQVVIGKATPTVVTQASPATGTVGVGITAKDTATLSGGASPTGTVTFDLYSTSGCTGAPVLSGSGTISGATASYSTSWTPAAPGTYNWQATYNGDANNGMVTTACGGSTEQVVIGKATPTVTTVASPTTGTVGVGITAKDTATLSGGASPTGTVTFDLYSTSGCTGTPVLSGSGTISGTTASYSTSWTPAAPGTYNWQATYNGDANNGMVTTACGGSTEQVVIGKAIPTVTTVASPTTGSVGVAIKTLKDTSTLSGTVIAPTGSVTFSLYATNACTGKQVVTGSGTISSSTASYSVKWTPASAGTYYWVASYPGDANNAAATSSCGSETVVITAQPTISTTPNPKSAGAGTTLQASATLAKTSNLTGTGSITFKLFGPGDTTCATVLHTETLSSVKTNGPFGTTTGFAAKTTGTYQWIASFSGDADNTAVSSSCGSAPVVVGPQISETTPAAVTCAQFASGFATGLSTIGYTVSGKKIGTVSVTGFTYWLKVTSSGTYTITQSTSETSSKLLLGTGSAVYDDATSSNCSTVASTITQKTSGGSVTVTFSSGTGPFYIGVNYSTSKLIGEAAPAPSTTVQYTLGAGLTGSSSVIDLKLT